MSDPQGDRVSMLLARALNRYSENGDTSLLPQAAREMAVAAGSASSHRPDVPAPFLDRMICAEMTYESGPEVAKAMADSIVRDTSFEIQLPSFKAKVWELFACCWRKEYEGSMDERSADAAIEAFGRAVDNGVENPRLPIYLHGLASALLERGNRTRSRDDMIRAVAALKRGASLDAVDLRTRSIYVASFVELAEGVEDDEVFVEVLMGLEKAAQNEAFDADYRNNIRFKLGELARDRVLSKRSIRLADEVEKILVASFVDLPKLDRYAQVLQDDVARVRGWRESLRPLGSTSG